MSSSERSSRRWIFLKLGVLLNGIAGLVLAVPILRFLFSPIARDWKPGYRAWVSLGSVGQFPAGQTRFATYRNPVVTPSDGETAGVPCWVRNIDGAQFQVFAINCAHLGCPVRWFPQSNLFLCPCHGGAYYADGSHAAGPPERGMFQYRYKVDGGNLFIEAGDMPTPGAPGALASLAVRRSPWA
jgi:nitrite reductase/ring-hydroxylating ferredoxin subunit